jgi:hypothetical protein
MQLGDNIRDGVAYAWDLLEAILRHHLLEGHGQDHQVFGCMAIGPRAIGIATAQGRALAEFVQQLGNRGSIERHYLIPSAIS